MTDFYDRPFVKEIQEIFGNPQPPSRVTERQWDNSQTDLDELAAMPWHEIHLPHWSCYLENLLYGTEQQDLFDYLMPALLVTWREGLEVRETRPQAFNCLYRCWTRMEPFQKLMTVRRRERTYDWMADGFVEAVRTMTAWEVSADKRNEELGFLLSTFHALGQTLPLTERILSRFDSEPSEGLDWYLLLIAAGMAWNENEVPFIKPWTPHAGGGGVYLTDTATESDNAFLPENLIHYRGWLTMSRLIESVEKARPTHPLFGFVGDRLREARAGTGQKLEWYFVELQKPSLGAGILYTPEFHE